uniref:Uncharacterized protein n=1 Tax=Arundo donax TaxID=35708 RepID=A0A0A9GII5_ARUDO
MILLILCTKRPLNDSTSCFCHSTL